MRLGKYINSLTKSELDSLIEELNLTDEEEEIVFYLARGKSNLQIADNCACSVATVGNRIKSVNAKLNKIKKGG